MNVIKSKYINVYLIDTLLHELRLVPHSAIVFRRAHKSDTLFYEIRTHQKHGYTAVLNERRV